MPVSAQLAPLQKIMAPLRRGNSLRQVATSIFRRPLKVMNNVDVCIRRILERGYVGARQLAAWHDDPQRLQRLQLAMTRLVKESYVRLCDEPKALRFGDIC